jgi:type II secretory pathway component PulM
LFQRTYRRKKPKAVRLQSELNSVGEKQAMVQELQAQVEELQEALTDLERQRGRGGTDAEQGTPPQVGHTRTARRGSLRGTRESLRWV